MRWNASRAMPRSGLLLTETLLAQSRLREAEAELARFHEATFEGDPQVGYLQARLILAEGDARSAAEHLRELAPRLDRAATQFWLAIVLRSCDIEGACRHYHLAQQRDPDWAAPIGRDCSHWSRAGVTGRAAAVQARSLVSRVPDETGGWIALVDALELLGEGVAAERVARQSLERFPDRAEPHVLLAKALRAQGKTEEALASPRRSAQPGPGTGIRLRTRPHSGHGRSGGTGHRFGPRGAGIGSRFRRAPRNAGLPALRSGCGRGGRAGHRSGARTRAWRATSIARALRVPGLDGELVRCQDRLHALSRAAPERRGSALHAGVRPARSR